MQLAIARSTRRSVAAPSGCAAAAASVCSSRRSGVSGEAEAEGVKGR